MTRVIFIRHGETNWNVQRLVQGSIDIPLNSTGEQQAQALAERLKHEPLHHIYTSFQKRAQKTAETVAKHHPRTPLTLRRDLTEYHMGWIEGKSLDFVQEHFQEKNWDKESFRQKIGGDSFEFYVKHFQRHLPALFSRHNNQTILLSTHGGKMKSLLYSLFPDPDVTEFIRTHHLTNCSLTEVEWYGPNHAELIAYNDDAHLQPLKKVDHRPQRHK